MDSRIHGKVVDIDLSAVRRFFEQREHRTTSEHPITSVLYQDSEPELAYSRDAAERDRLLPLLHLSSQATVLDIACGIGRWANPIVDSGARYVGIDFSEKMLAVARENTAPARSHFASADLSKSRLTELDLPWQPDRVLICGLLMYLNDGDVSSLAWQIPEAVQPTCRIVLREPLGVDNRFTLDQFESTELGADYSAVYRTREEVLELFGQPLEAQGFELTMDEWLHDGHLNNRSETRQRFFVWQR